MRKRLSKTTIMLVGLIVFFSLLSKHRIGVAKLEMQAEVAENHKEVMAVVTKLYGVKSTEVKMLKKIEFKYFNKQCNIEALTKYLKEVTPEDK